MQDRVSLYPGRVTLTPVEGQVNTYDLVRADQPTQAGTPLNKAALMTDETAKIFNFMSGCTPEDAFEWFRPYSLHSWRIRGVSSYYKPIVSSSGSSSSKTLVKGLSSSTDTCVELLYSASVSADAAGNIFLSSPRLIYCYKDGRNLSAVRAALSGQYFRFSGYYDGSYNGQTVDDTIYLDGSGGNFSWSGLEFRVGYPVYTVSAMQQSGTGQWTYAASEDRDAYPDSGIVDGTEYEYMGVPFENIKGYIPKFTALNYKGSGVYGSGAPNSVTVDFPIKCLRVCGESSYEDVLYISGATNSSGITFLLSADQKTLSWYGSSADKQQNSANTNYYVAVFG